MDPQILAFTGVAALLTITPGADMALVARTALARGNRAALETTFGIIGGLFVWGCASALGLAAVFATSATAFTALKLAGAAYLIGLGVVTIVRAGRSAESAPQPARGLRRAGRSPFAQGFLSNVLNPKIALFYTSLLPQFVGPDDPVLPRSLLLAGIHGALGLIWLSLYARALTGLGGLLRRPRARRVLDRVTGGALVVLGARLAALRH
jgi:threonine/homoserine/homoserine lactone efflux protein